MDVAVAMVRYVAAADVVERYDPRDEMVAKVPEAYVNVGNEEEALAMVSYVEDAYAYGT